MSRERAHLVTGNQLWSPVWLSQPTLVPILVVTTNSGNQLSFLAAFLADCAALLGVELHNRWPTSHIAVETLNGVCCRHIAVWNLPIGEWQVQRVWDQRIWEQA